MNKPKGTKDNYGKVQVVRDYIKSTVGAAAFLNNFKEIETPIFESSDVYKRSVGETSDIVSKEMYVFNDKKGREMVLRPEGTAGTIRAIVENKLFAEALPLKVYYYGPMFRYERPQKGRQRQFTQFGVEMLSDKSPYVDAEVIMFAHSILESLNIENKLILNSLGDSETRNNYSKALKKYFDKYKGELTKDSINRLDKNPLRILDDKIDGEKDFVKNAPKINEYYSKETKEYFEKVTSFLTKMDIAFEVDYTMVRGLDYYADTSFEFVSTSGKSGSRSTIIGGGRYDNLVQQFGGPKLSGIGFGLGVERIMNELDHEAIFKENNTLAEIFILNIADEVQETALGIVYMLRRAGFITEWNNKPVKLQKAFKLAERSGAKINIIIGEKELSEGNVVVKFNGEQETIKIGNIIDNIDGKLGV